MTGPVLITGAGSGIGLATARRLGRTPGARLALVGRREDDVVPVVQELTGEGADAVAIGVDLATVDGPAAAVARTVEHFGELAAVVSNAGTNSSRSSLVELSVDEYERTFAVNTRATWLLARAAHPHLAAASGALVAVASVAGRHAASPLGAYSASKAALMLLVQQLAFEWGPDGITCNSVCPGMVLSPMSPAVNDEILRRRRDRRIPLRRHGDTDEVAALIQFLIGPDARYISGEDITIDGGVRTAFFPAMTGVIEERS